VISRIVLVLVIVRDRCTAQLVVLARCVVMSQTMRDG